LLLGHPSIEYLIFLDDSGHKIAWTHKYCGGDREKFISLCRSPTADLVKHIDSEILLYTAVNGSDGKLKGIKPPDSSLSEDASALSKKSKIDAVSLKQSEKVAHIKVPEEASVDDSLRELLFQYGITVLIVLIAFVVYQYTKS
jgi:hypothetical protein